MTYLDPKKVPVVSQDSENNTYMQEVIGNKTDTYSGTSLFSNIKLIQEHLHSASNVYPTLADGITVTSSASEWTLGEFVEIIPASTISTDFDIHNVEVSAISDNDVYELVIYKGALSSEVEVGRVRFSKSTNQEGTTNQPFQTLLIGANSRVSAKVACAAGSSHTVTISLRYHTY